MKSQPHVQQPAAVVRGRSLGPNASARFRFGLRGLCWFAVACLFVSLPARAQVIKLGTVAPEGSPWHDALQELAGKWQELSNGQVRLRIYAGGVAGDETDMLRKIRIGQLHATALTAQTLTSIVPDIEAISFPLLLKTNGELDYVLKTLGPRFENELEQKGFKVLGWSSAGWVHIFAKTPVTTIDDLRERKLFFWGTDTDYIETLKSVGIDPVPLAITDLLPSLQTGLVNAFAAPPVAALSFQWFGLAPHMTDLRWMPLPGVTVISARRWRQIPEKLRPKLEDAAWEISTKIRKRTRQLEKDAIEAMKKHGLSVHDVPQEAREEWARIVKEKGYASFVGKRFSKEAYDAVKAAVEEHRSKHAGAAGTGS